MKIKDLVAFALFISVFLFASIFLINFVKNPAFVFLYFIFVFFWLIAIGISLKKTYPEQIKILFLIIPILLIALSLTFFGISVKNYYEESKEITSSLDPNSQIGNLEKTNQYYTDYVAFLNDEILKTRDSSLDLQSQIDNFIAQQNSANQIPNTTQNNIPIYIYEDDEEEEEND